MNANIAFWDTSAIVPLCCNQKVSLSARKAHRNFRVPVIWWGTPVEIHSAFARLTVEGSLNVAQSAGAVRTWMQLYKRARKIRPEEELLELAISMPAAYNVRAMDAFQLAAALIWCGERPRNRPFFTADNRLAEAAAAAGFDVVSLA